jgi:hypothetical protein
MAARVTKVTKQPSAAAGRRASVAPVAAPPLVATTIQPDEIRMRAYLKWEAAGRPCGDGMRFWLEAERELNGRA